MGDYSSAWGTGSASSASSSSSSSLYDSYKKSKGTSVGEFRVPTVTISLIHAMFLVAFATLVGMVLTANRMERDPDGNFANCCRVALRTVHCTGMVIYNLYHCRLGDIPRVVFASEYDGDDDDDYTDEEIERMRPRAGIERALDVEHRRALRKVGIELNKIRATGSNGTKASGKSTGTATTTEAKTMGIRDGNGASGRR